GARAFALHVAGVALLIGRCLLPSVLLGLLLDAALAQLSFAVELRHRGLLVPACCHACPPALGIGSPPTACANEVKAAARGTDTDRSERGSYGNARSRGGV